MSTLSIDSQKAVFPKILVYTSRGTHLNVSIRPFFIAIARMSYFNEVLCNAQKKWRIGHILICYFSSFFGTVYHILNDKLYLALLLQNGTVHIWMHCIMQYCNLESCLKWLIGCIYTFHCYYESWLHQYRRKNLSLLFTIIGNIWFLSWKSSLAVLLQL